MSHFYILLFFALLIEVGVLTASAGTADTKRQADQVLDELRASDKEWQQNDAEFRSLRRNKSLPEDGVNEFAEFVAALRRKMLENCQVFRTLGGAPEKHGFDCKIPNEKPLTEKELPQIPTVVQTEREKAAALDASLSKSMNEFDQAVQQKQDKARVQLGGGQGSTGSRASRNETTPGGKIQSKAGTGGFKAGGSAPKSSATRPKPRLADPGAGPGVEKAAVITSTGAASGGGNDDDVVARQLREAAEKEQDPLMKEKLWDEYRKYRASKH